MGGKAQLAAEHRRPDDVVVVYDGMHPGIGIGRVGEQQAAELVELGGKVVAIAHALQIDGIDAVGLQNRIELVEAAEALVAVSRDVPSEPPP